MRWLTLDEAGRNLGGNWIFRRLNLDLEGTERIFLTGKSGSGKSTLLRVLAGLEPLQEGRRATAVPELEFRSRAVYLPQTPAFFPGTVEENLRLPFQWKSHRSKSAPDFAEMFEAMGMGQEFLAKPANRLSGGERQAAALVRAVALGPRFLFLDEPLSAMDRELASRVEEWVRGLPVGFVWITHGDVSGTHWRLSGGNLHV